MPSNMEYHCQSWYRIEHIVSEGFTLEFEVDPQSIGEPAGMPYRIRGVPMQVIETEDHIIVLVQVEIDVLPEGSFDEATGIIEQEMSRRLAEEAEVYEDILEIAAWYIEEKDMDAITETVKSIVGGK